MDEIIRLIQAEIDQMNDRESTWSKGAVYGMRHAIRIIRHYCKTHRCYCDEMNQQPPADGEVLEEIGGQELAAYSFEAGRGSSFSRPVKEIS